MPCNTATALLSVGTFFQWVTVALSTTAISLPQLLYFNLHSSYSYNNNVWLGAWQICSTGFGCNGINPMSDLSTDDGNLLQVYRAFGTMGAGVAFLMAILSLVRAVHWGRKSQASPAFDGVVIGGSALSMVSLMISMGVSAALYCQFSGIQWFNNQYYWWDSIRLGASFCVQVVACFTALVALKLHAIGVKYIKKAVNANATGDSAHAGLLSSVAVTPSPFCHPQPSQVPQPVYLPTPSVNVYAGPGHYHHYSASQPGAPQMGLVHYPIHAHSSIYSAPVNN